MIFLVHKRNRMERGLTPRMIGVVTADSVDEARKKLGLPFLNPTEVHGERILSYKKSSEHVIEFFLIEIKELTKENLSKIR